MSWTQARKTAVIAAVVARSLPRTTAGITPDTSAADMAADIAADVVAYNAVDMTVDMFVATHGNIHALPWQVADSRGSARRARRGKTRTCPRVSAKK